MKKRFYRSRSNQMISGVCSGIGEYFNIDATLIRLIFVISALFGGAGILVYIICLIIMPLKPEDENL